VFSISLNSRKTVDLTCSCMW